MKKIKYSIVIPTKDRVRLCQRLIDTIDKSIVFSKINPSLFELIIVDDSGIEHKYSSSVLKQKILVNTKKHNAAYSRNRGGAISTGEYIIFFDDDIIIPKDYFKILESIAKKVDFDILGSRVYPTTSKARDIYLSLIFAYVRKVGFLASVNLVIRSEFFSKVNFDEGMWVSEDYKYFFDALQHKPRIYYSKRLSVYHSELSLFKVLNKLNSYAKGCRNVQTRTSSWFTKIGENKIFEVDDDISLRDRYSGLPAITQFKLLFFTFYLLGVFILYNRSFLIKNVDYSLGHVLNALSYAQLTDNRRPKFPGWLTEKEACKLRYLSKHRPQGDILEIGHFCGKSTINLAKRLHQNEKIFSVDNHSFDSKYSYNHGGIVVPKDSLSEFNKNLKRHNLTTKVIPTIKSSNDAFESLQNKTFSLIFIDGSHDYADVKKDADNYSKLLINRGILALHDAMGDFAWEGPKKVYNEFLDNNNLEFIGKTGSMAYFRKR